LKEVSCRKNEIVKCAALCRKQLGLKATEAIRDICGLLEYAGVKVYPLSMASEGFFGLSIGESEGGPAVVVNIWERVGVERQIFSAAHELGHLILHEEAFDVSKTEEDKKQEKEADSFAGHFLMPDEGFRKEWGDAAGLHPVDRVIKVKRMLRVSYKTVLHRLIENGLADDSIWKKFNFAFQQKFKRPLGHKEEPFPMERFDFAEDRFSGLVRKAVEGENISLSRGAEIFRVSINEMREIMNQWKSAL
jgi:Zn-dependent peptidase ImmA (M78 family)